MKPFHQEVVERRMFCPTDFSAGLGLVSHRWQDRIQSEFCTERAAVFRLKWGTTSSKPVAAHQRDDFHDGNSPDGMVTGKLWRWLRVFSFRGVSIALG